MVSVKIPSKPTRWFAPDDKARKKLEALGVRRCFIYEAKEGERWEKITMKSGEGLGVIGGWKAFGGKVAIKKAEARFHGQGATVIDVMTGQNSRSHSASMFQDATGARRFTPEEKAARAKEAANKRRKASGAMLDYDARIEWHRKDGKSVDEKAEYIGWPRSSLSAMFGPSGNPPGRRPKQVEAD